MAGGAFGNAAEGAERLANSLHGVETISHSLTGTLGVLKIALNAALGVTFKNELERTAQALYKVRTSLGATASDAMKFAEAVRHLNASQVTATRGLIEMFAVLRNSSGMMTRSNSQLADIAKRLQREFPQASADAAKAIAQMADQTVDFERLMAKGTNSSLAWAEANQKFGAEYARVLLAARGELGATVDQQRMLLNAMEESEAAAHEMQQSLATAFKSTTLGVAGMVKSFSELVTWFSKLGNGEVGKALSPIIAAGASMMAMKGGIGMMRRYAGDQGFAALSAYRGSGARGALSNAGGLALVDENQNTPAYLRQAGQAGSRYSSMAAMAKRVGAWFLPSRRLGAEGMFGNFQTLSEQEKFAMKPEELKAYNREVRIQKGIGIGYAALAGAQTYSSAKMSGATGESATTGSILGASGAGAAAGMAFGPAGMAIGAGVGALMNAHVQTGAYTNHLLEVIRDLNSQGNRIAEQQLLAERVAAAPTAAAGREMLRGQYAFNAQSAAMNIEVAKKEQERATAQLKTTSGALQGNSGIWNYIFNQKSLQKAQQTEASLALAQQQEQKAREEYAQAQAQLIQSGQFEVGVGQASIGSVQAKRTLLSEAAKSGDFGSLQGMMFTEAARRSEMIGKRNINIGSMIGANIGIEQGSEFRTKIGTRFGELGAILGGGKDALTTQQELSRYLGFSEDMAKNIYRIWESTPAIQQEIVNQINDQNEALRTQKSALLDVTNREIELLSIRQQGIEAQKNIASALKLSPQVQAQLTAKQIGMQSSKLKDVVEQLRIMESNTDKYSDKEIANQRTLVEQTMAELANQVDYIRRGWEETFTQAALNLPGGSYLMPTMTGMMEKGPAFAPFTASSMAGGNLVGHGTYEEIMGVGKASAFGLMGKHIQDAIDGPVQDFSGAVSEFKDAIAALRSGRSAE
jgi:hypothetical protein